MANPSQTFTINEFILEGKNVPITHYNCTLVEKINDGSIIFPVKNILDDYIDELKAAAITVTLKDAEYRKYVYSPKLLAYDIYGYTDLFFLIMFLNDVQDVKDFNFKKLKLLRKSDLSIINRILNAEKKTINENRVNLNK